MAIATSNYYVIINRYVGTYPLEPVSEHKMCIALIHYVLIHHQLLPSFPAFAFPALLLYSFIPISNASPSKFYLLLSNSHITSSTFHVPRSLFLISRSASPSS